MAVMALAMLAAVAEPDPVLARMLQLYDTICLQTFPIDGQVDALMARSGATALTADEVKVTLRDDPGRGWIVKDGDADIQVMIEMPPYHACSVRRMTEHGFADLSTYDALVDGYRATHRGFEREAPYDADVGTLHVHATGWKRALPGGSGETLYVFDQHVTDPAQRAAGSTRVSVRFVHQIVDPGAH